MKIFLDTNIWVRYLIDDSKQTEDCDMLIRYIERGFLQPYTSNIVFLECVYVLEKLYGVSSSSLKEILDAMLETRSLTIYEKTDTQQALLWHKNLSVKYADCLIATQIPQDVTLVSYDRDFDQFPTLHRQEPPDINALLRVSSK
jgi:predicted nucleic acid-binding protein